MVLPDTRMHRPLQRFLLALTDTLREGFVEPFDHGACHRLSLYEIRAVVRVVENDRPGSSVLSACLEGSFRLYMHALFRVVSL